MKLQDSKKKQKKHWLTVGKTRKYVAAPSSIKANFIFAFLFIGFVCVMGENDIFKKKNPAGGEV